MAEYDNKNTFTLFRNNKKRPDKNDADFNGTFTDADGNEYWLNAWSKTPKSGGDKFLSGTVRLKQPRQDSPPPASQKKSAELDDEVPF